MADRHATQMDLFICIALSFLLPTVNHAASLYEDGRSRADDSGVRLTREYHLMQGAIRGMIVKPSRQYDLQSVEMFLGVPYAAPPVANLRFMPPVNAPPWPGVKMATRFAAVCPQSIPAVKKGNPPTLGRQHYMNRLKPFLSEESEDCLYLNIYVPYREHKSKKFPVLVFIHGDSFEWSSGNPYDGRVLASYGNIMVVTVNYRLGILGFMLPSISDQDYNGNNGLFDQIAALQWVKDNIEDLNGDSNSVTVMGHSTGAACVSLLMLSPISQHKELFHRAILMSGSALSDWAITKEPAQYTLQVAQSLGCQPTAKDLMQCLQNKTLSDIKKVQILAREFETPLGPTEFFNPAAPADMMTSFPNFISKYQLLSGVTELESYHDFGVIELDHGVLENQRDDFIKKYAKKVLDGAEINVLKEVLKQYAPSKLDPQRWSVEGNRDVILDAFSDARTLTPMINFAKYQAKTNRQSYFYVFGHNSISTDYAQLNKSVHGQEMPYVLGVPLGGTKTHFHAEYTPEERLLSEVVMRLWTNFVKMGTPNTQSVNEYYSLSRKQWNHYNVEWPEYNTMHQSYLRLDLPPNISSMYRYNFTNFWSELPNKMRKFVIDPLYQYTPITSTTHRPKASHRNVDPIRKIHSINNNVRGGSSSRYVPPAFGRMVPYPPPVHKPETEMIYREIPSIKTQSRTVPPVLMEKATPHTTTAKPRANNVQVKTSSATITLIVSLGVLFLAVNVGICAILYFKKRKLRFRERAFEGTRHSRAEIGEVDVIGQKGAKDDKSALKTFKNGCSVIKSMGMNKIRSNSKKGKNKTDMCKTPKSDDSGGFRQRFELRRHLSTSTLDANTKVRDWIANEVMHRCSPGILRKSNTELNVDKHLKIAKPFTRSEELLSDKINLKTDTLMINDKTKSKTLQSKTSNKTKTSEKTTSTSALGSHSSIGSTKQSLNSKVTEKSNESLKSKGTDSVRSKKVSVAIDATPAARTNSILKQEPIEILKSFDCIEPKHSKEVNNFHKAVAKNDQIDIIEIKPENKDKSNQLYTNEVTLSLNRDKPLKISHKHSSSDPVTDVNYDLMQEKLMSGPHVVDILPPMTFRNDINVTSRDESARSPAMTAAEALLTIQRRNFPKVLPDLPKAQKRLSLQPTSFQTFRSYIGSPESQSDRPKVPPQPPPRTTTLERRLAYKNTKQLSSFETANVRKINEMDSYSKNYENINSLSPDLNRSKTLNRSFDSSPSVSDKSSPVIIIPPTDFHRDYPKIIIASSDIPYSESKIVITPSASHSEIPSNAPRVRLPDDFHTHSGSVSSFSTYCSEDDDIEDVDDEFIDDIAEDKLIKELVGGVESPTNLDDVLDSKGPETMFEKKLEIVPVILNPGQIVPKNKEDYVCISDLYIPDVSNSDKTAQIKPNFGLNKLQHRSESIHKPPEKTVKVKQKRSIKPATILNKSFKSSRKSSEKIKSDPTKLEHSNSGSSNDTEASTGTVREVKKD